MSYAYAWREVCASTPRDSYTNWLHRLVKLIFHSPFEVRSIEFRPERRPASTRKGIRMARSLAGLGVRV